MKRGSTCPFKINKPVAKPRHRVVKRSQGASRNARILAVHEPAPLQNDSMSSCPIEVLRPVVRGPFYNVQEQLEGKAPKNSFIVGRKYGKKA